MTMPKLICGLPQDYAILAFIVSLGIGGLGGLVFFQNGLGAFVGVIPIASIFWVIGYFLTKKDPEFLGVWLKACFNIGELVAFDGKRHYEP